jgi:CRISPR-associated protein (TIGR03986 family)
MSINAPYNFVPLSKQIYQPDWAAKVSHDIPFSDGISGNLELEITAHTPILIGDDKQKQGTEARPGEVHFFQLPDERYAIPGTSLKGMLRNVLEIATYGKMRLVDDQWLSVRDLSRGGKFYTKHLSQPLGGNTFRPLARAGWLQLDPEKLEWQLTPCQYARVEQEHLIQWGRKNKITNPQQIKKKQNSISKYLIFRHRHLQFNLETNTNWFHQKGRIKLEYKKAQATLGTGKYQGEIIFTGQPTPNTGQPGRKHMEFIFYNDSPTPKTVDETVMQAFQKIHEESEEWQHWYEKIRHGNRIPVFYLEKAGKISSLGLAMMYRLPYKNSIGETINHTNPDHRNTELFDLPELIFGSINEDNSQFSLKSRVSFGMAYLENQARELTDLPTTILGSPKASYYPNYVQQQSSPKLKGGNYQTYMGPDAKIRGWKRYPINPRWKVKRADADLTNKVKVRLYPLAKGARFKCHLNFHNLRPAELGAIIWGLTWGGDSKLRHNLGMGKPYGLGQISIKIKAENLQANNPQLTVAPTQTACLKQFKSLMGKVITNWETSTQLTQLLAMANPTTPAPCKLEYMSLPEFRNEKQHKSVLPAYGGTK